MLGTRCELCAGMGISVCSSFIFCSHSLWSAGYMAERSGGKVRAQVIVAQTAGFHSAGRMMSTWPQSSLASLLVTASGSQCQWVPFLQCSSADTCAVCSLTSSQLCSKSDHFFGMTCLPTGIPVPPPRFASIRSLS